MKTREIYKLALNRVGEREGDRQIDNVVMAGINAAYKMLAIKFSKSKTQSITVTANMPVTLPTDFISLVMITKTGIGRLAENEFFINSDLLLVTNAELTGTMNLIYNYIPADLAIPADDNVEPNIPAAYHSALAAYAAYYYYNYKNNLNAANICYQEFMNITGLPQDKISQSQPSK